MKRVSGLLTAAVLSILTISSVSQAAVWDHDGRSWTMEDENRYSEFVRSLPLDLFTNSNSPWSGLPTDCADAAYAVRIIFAYQNRLPVKFNHSTENLSNLNNQFDTDKSGNPESELKRVRRFILYVGKNTNTRSITQDTYPVVINRLYVRPGSLFVHAASGSNVPITYRSGHVYLLQSVADNGMIKYISSTVPIAVRDLDPRFGIDFAPQDSGSGYRAWKWPNSSDRPGYSDEQYRIGGWRAGAYGDFNLWDRWQEAIQSRLRSRHMSSDEMLNAAVFNLKTALASRAKSVLTGWNYYQKRYGGQGCMNNSDYDDHSTPTRDVKIQNELYKFDVGVNKYIQQRGGSRQAIYQHYNVEVYQGARVNFWQVYNTFMTNVVLEISEPEHPPAVRWGMQSWGLRNWPCPHRAKQYKGGDQVAH